MAINKEKYIGKYIDEGLEIIALVEGLVFDIKDGISVDDDLATLMRALHTLKGTSRMLEFKRIEELTHALESVFTAIKEQRIGLTANAVKLILATLDLVKQGLGLVQHTKDDTIEIQEYVKKLNALAANEEYTLPETPTPKTDVPAGVVTPKTVEDTVAPDKHTGNAQSPQPVPAENSPDVSAPAGKPNKDAKSESIRLSIEKIDGIIKV